MVLLTYMYHDARFRECKVQQNALNLESTAFCLFFIHITQINARNMERITIMENGCSQRRSKFSSYFSFSTQENPYKRFTGHVTPAYDLKTADEIQTFLRFPRGAVTPGERVERQLGWGEELAPQICFPPTCSFHPYKHPRRTCPALSRSFGQIKATVSQVYFTHWQADWWQRNKTEK